MTDPAETERLVLLCLLEAQPAPLSMQEVARSVGDELAVRDAVAQLARDGLAHRQDALTHTTLAARRVSELFGGLD